MRGWIAVAMGGVMALALLAGCGEETPTPKPKTGPTKVDTSKEAPAKAAAGITLCGKCGQVKGSDVCCKADAEICEKCGLVVGSPGCCRINNLATK